MPVAFTSTSTSPAFGPSNSTSVITSGFAFSNATAARVFMAGSSSSLLSAPVEAEDASKMLRVESFAAGDDAVAGLAFRQRGRGVRDGLLPRNVRRPISKKLLVSTERYYTETRGRNRGPRKRSGAGRHDSDFEARRVGTNRPAA